MAGIVKSAQAITALFSTSSPTTGAATNADSLPTGTLYVNGTADAATVTVTNITTGRYKAAVTLPALAAGDSVDIWIAATVGGVAGGNVVWSAIGDTKRLSDTLAADVVAISGDTSAADNLEAAADGTGYNLGGGSVVSASVTGAVGSVTGNVGGNVTGSVGSVATGGITAGSIAADAIGASELAADAVAEIQSGLALEASVQTVLSRLGAFAGSGVNTVLGFFKALAKSDAAAPSDMGGTFDPATDSLEAHTDGSGGGASAAEVWAYSSRTLTQTAASVAAAVQGSTLAVTRGDTFSASLTGLGNITTRTALWFTVKADPAGDADTAAKIQITEAGGLLYLNGAAATSGQGSISVTNATTGALTITVAAAATAQLDTPSTWVYDLQWKDATGLIRTLTRGTMTVSDDVTRAVS